MGFFKAIFGGKGEDTGNPDYDPVLDHVDPETGFEHAWSDEKRHNFCMETLKKIKGRLGGELRMSDEEMRLYTEWKGRAVVVGADWFTGSLVVSIVGKNRLGPIGIMRDEALDEDGEVSEGEHPVGWSEDTMLAGDVREYVAEGIYFDTPQKALAYERKRFDAIPDALRSQILDAMLHARLQSIFTSEWGLDLTWERSFFREGDLAQEVGAHLDLSTAISEVFENNPDPDPNSPNSERRCPYCGQKIIDLYRTKCNNCGGLL